MKKIITGASIIFSTLFTLSLISCNNTPSGPDAEPTPMPAVYVLENAESANDWVVCADEFGNMLSDVAIVSPGSNASGHAIAITLTVTTTGTGAPYTDNAFSFKPAPAAHSETCSEHVMTTYGGPDLTGYTSVKFDAKVSIVTPPASGTLAYGVEIQASTSCAGEPDKNAGAAFTPSSVWAEISIPLNTFTPAGAYTLAQVYGDILWVEFSMDISSSAINDKAVAVLYLDNLRFE